MQIMNLDRLIIGHALSFAKHVSLDRQPHAPAPKVRWYFGTELFRLKVSLVPQGGRH